MNTEKLKKKVHTYAGIVCNELVRFVKKAGMQELVFDIYTEQPERPANVLHRILQEANRITSNTPDGEIPSSDDVLVNALLHCSETEYKRYLYEMERLDEQWCYEWQGRKRIHVAVHRQPFADRHSDNTYDAYALMQSIRCDADGNPSDTELFYETESAADDSFLSDDASDAVYQKASSLMTGFESDTMLAAMNAAMLAPELDEISLKGLSDEDASFLLRSLLYYIAIGPFCDNMKTLERLTKCSSCHQDLTALIGILITKGLVSFQNGEYHCSASFASRAGIPSVISVPEVYLKDKKLTLLNAPAGQTEKSPEKLAELIKEDLRLSGKEGLRGHEIFSKYQFDNADDFVRVMNVLFEQNELLVERLFPNNMDGGNSQYNCQSEILYNCNYYLLDSFPYEDISGDRRYLTRNVLNRTLPIESMKHHEMQDMLDSLLIRASSIADRYCISGSFFDYVEGTEILSLNDKCALSVLLFMPQTENTDASVMLDLLERLFDSRIAAVWHLCNIYATHIGSYHKQISGIYFPNVFASYLRDASAENRKTFLAMYHFLCVQAGSMPYEHFSAEYGSSFERFVSVLCYIASVDKDDAVITAKTLCADTAFSYSVVSSVLQNLCQNKFLVKEKRAYEDRSKSYDKSLYQYHLNISEGRTFVSAEKDGEAE